MTIVVHLRALEHFAYCERQGALIHVDGRWTDNRHTVTGRRGHLRVDSAPSRMERGRHVLRGMALWSEGLGLALILHGPDLRLSGGMIPIV